MSITATPVVGEARPGYDPVFPAAHGFSAHTPDPAKYHKRGDHTILPLSRGTISNHISRGFNHEKPGLVFVDATDPVNGTGATARFNLGEVSESHVQQVLRELPPELDPRERAAQAMEAIANPVTKAAAPTPVVAEPVQPPPAPTAAAQGPSYDPAAPPTVSAPPWPPVAVAYQPNPWQPQPMPGPALPPSTLPCPAPAAPQPGPADLQKLADYMLRELRPAAPAPPVQPATPAEPRYTLAELREALRLPYLSAAWEAPQVAVTFMTSQGAFRSLYHDVCRRGLCVTLTVDSRQDAQLLFVPKEHMPGDPPLRLICESRQLDLFVANCNFHNSTGVYDHYNLVVVDAPDDHG